MALVERTHEFSILTKLLSDCARKKGSAVLVTGATGQGKTELLDNFAAHAKSQGALTLKATCSQLEKEIPFITIGELLRSIEMPGDLADDTKAFLQLAQTDVNARNTQPVRHQAPVDMIEGFYQLLLKISRHTPVVIGVDDSQHMDTPSLQCVLHFIRRMRSTQAVIVMTENSKTPPAHPLFYTDFLSQRHCHQIHLHPLTKNGVIEVLSQKFGDAKLSDIGPEIFRATGGNPLFLNALIMDYRTAGDMTPNSVVLGSHFRQAVLMALRRIDPALIQMAQGLALIQETDAAALLDRLYGTGTGTARHAVQILTDIGLVSKGTFRHPAVGLALLDELPAEERAEMHLCVARLLHLHGAAQSVVAQHLLDARSTNAPWAIPVLEEASEQALADNDRERAVRLLNLAHQMCPDEQPRSSIRALLLDSTWGLESSAPQQHLSTLVADLREGRLPARHAFMLARHLVWSGYGGKSLDVLRSLQKRYENGELAAANEAEIVQTWISCTQPPIVTRQYVAPHAARRESMSDIRMRASALLHSALTKGAHHVFIGDIEQILRSTKIVTNEDCNIIVSALLSLIYTDRTDQSLVWCDRFIRASSTADRPEILAILRSVQAEARIRRGDLHGARRSALDSLSLLSRESWGIGIGSPVSTLVLTHTGMGAHKYAEEYLEYEVPHDMYHTRFGLQLLYSQGRHHLSLRKAETALIDFTSCGDLMRAWGIDRPGFLPWRSGAAEAQIQLGNRRAARTLIEDQLSLLGNERARTWGLSLRVLAEAADPVDRSRLFTDAAKVLHACGDRLELARALAGLGRTHHLQGNARQAKAVMRRAQEVAKECGATISAIASTDRYVNELSNSANVNADASRILYLSNAERRVASLATRGHSNREISDQLFITISTVEQHLTRIYRKLGIRGRSDLPSDLYFDGLIPF